MTARRLAALFLLAEAVGGAAWWALLLTYPPSRRPFLAAGAPDNTLLAFGPADGLLFVGGAAVAAFGLARRKPWAWPALLVHAGAAAYAGLYCWGLVLVTGDGVFGALLMSPSLVVPGLLARRLRPGGPDRCSGTSAAGSPGPPPPPTTC